MDDEGGDWVEYIIKEVCGLDRSSDLTMKILEDHLEDILIKLGEWKEGIKKSDDEYARIALGYQVLALFLLETGSFVPEVVKEEVLYSTTWEYEKRWWGSWGPDSFRKEFLNKLREAVENQVLGKKYKF